MNAIQLFSLECQYFTHSFLSSHLCCHCILIWDTEMTQKFDIREVRWLGGSWTSNSLPSHSYTSTVHRAMLPLHTGWIQGLTSHPCFKIQTPISPPEANGRNRLRTPSPVPALPFVKNFPVCRPPCSYLELAKLFTCHPPLSIDQVETVITQWSSRQPARQEHQHDAFPCTGRFAAGT